MLLADDDDTLRESFRLWLERHGVWTVREATDGADALDKLRPSVDALVVDRSMPALTGPELVARLPDTGFDGPVVVVSAHEPDGHLDAAAVDEYLVKPLEYGDLHATLAESLPSFDPVATPERDVDPV